MLIILRHAGAGVHGADGVHGAVTHAGTADVAAHLFADQADRGLDLGRRALTAMERVDVDTGLLYRVQSGVPGETFDRFDFLALGHDREHRTGGGAAVVHELRGDLELTQLTVGKITDIGEDFSMIVFSGYFLTIS